VIPIKITDSSSSISARVDSANNEIPGLVVATRPYKQYIQGGEFFSNPTYGAEMNKNGGYSGTPNKIHDGIDTVLWTASAIVGGPHWDFTSTAQAHGGTHSIDATGTNNGDIAQFAKGSALTLANYVAVTGWIYLDAAWPTSGTKQILLYGWDTGTGLQVGNAINIGNYINRGRVGTWQSFAVPLADFGFTQTTIDAFRVQTVDVGPELPPSYYLDDLQVEEQGSPLTYTFEPQLGFWYHFTKFKMTCAFTAPSTLLNATMPYLSYNKFFGLTELTNGILYQRWSGGDIVWSTTIRRISSLVQFSSTYI
jgi:hypothetical protein